MIKSWFKRDGRELTVDELIVLERYDEAESRLRAQLRRNTEDAHTRAKLAEVLSALGRSPEAVAEYTYVAELYRDDGFYDKSAAMLLRAIKLDPKSEELRLQLTKVEREKSSARNRQQALDALRLAAAARGSVELHFVELQYLWAQLAETALFSDLPAEQIPFLLKHLRILRLPPHELLKERGDQAPALIIVASGAVETRVLKGERKINISSHGAGDVIGESSLFELKPWPADTLTIEPATILELTREGLEAALAGNPNPRGLIDALRRQENDIKIRTWIQELGA
jgi:tetratricopeptide (TPR) repeat protein